MREMERLHVLYPGYGFNTSHGYASDEHKAGLAKLGFCSIHRRNTKASKHVPRHKKAH